MCMLCRDFNMACWNFFRCFQALQTLEAIASRHFGGKGAFRRGVRGDIYLHTDNAVIE
jgi:hypothetical protein